MNYYTVKQLANEFHVTKQAIRYQITSKKLSKFTSKKNINGVKTLIVNKEGYYQIKQIYKPNNSNDFTSKKDNNFTSKKLSNFTDKKDSFTSKDILYEKERAISLLIKENENLHNEINELHTELQHEQDLHLMDQKQVKTLENKIKELQQPKKEQEKEKKPSKKHWWKWW